MTATFPLQSCRMVASLIGWLLWRSLPVHGDRTRLGTAIETNAATGAVVSHIARGMHAIGIQSRKQFEAFRRTRFDTQPASLALVRINRHFAARLPRHNHLAS